MTQMLKQVPCVSLQTHVLVPLLPLTIVIQESLRVERFRIRIRIYVALGTVPEKTIMQDG